MDRNTALHRIDTRPIRKMTSLEGVPLRARNGSDLGVTLPVRAAEIPLVTPANGTAILLAPA